MTTAAGIGHRTGDSGIDGWRHASLSAVPRGNQMTIPDNWVAF
jgi:hypothetical protein